MTDTRSVGDIAPVLLRIIRGKVIESQHRGHIAVVDGRGELVASYGNPDLVTFARSSAKPIQALPLVSSGAANHFGFTDEEIALACGSHNGEPIHTNTAAGMLAKAGLTLQALRCGAHLPYAQKLSLELQCQHRPPTPLHNNCSGKHSGMLALAQFLKASVASYDAPDHPVQSAIFTAVSQMSDLPLESIQHAIDGCGVPTFALPLRRLALMFARLMTPPEVFVPTLKAACSRIVDAITAFPVMVEGENELDTELIRVAKGQIISKVGAETVFAAGAKPSHRWPYGLGVAIKIEDGQNQRARPRAAIHLLHQLGLLGDGEIAALKRFIDPVIRNHRGDLVGEIKPVFKLERY